MPFLNFSSAHRDAVARLFVDSPGPGTCSAYSAAAAAGAGVPSGEDDGAVIVRAALAARLT